MQAIGRYRVTRQLGAGSFATVWLAFDDDLDTPVAIKVLADIWTTNADVQRRFVDEARVLRRIQDPRLVGVHDIGRLPDGRSYFVMDYADAGTVVEFVRERVEPRQAVGIAVEVARAVQVLHDHGVLHRDVKPGNLLLRRRADGTTQLLLADLGTAKALAEASSLTLTAGTPAYMAPEQAHGQRPLSERTDVYGVAAVTYALLAGGPPFPVEGQASDVAFRDQGLSAAPLDTATWAGVDGDALNELLRQGLAFDPDRRPPTAAAFADRLAGTLVRDGATGTGATGTGSTGAADEPSTVRTDRVASVPVPDTVRAPAMGLSVRRLVAWAVVVLLVVTALTWFVLGLVDR